jgi:hypothetical protein
MSSNSKQSDYSLLNPFTLVGALASDIVEVLKDTGEATMNIPNAISAGWDEGLILDTEKTKAKKLIEQLEEELANQESPEDLEQEIEEILPPSPDEELLALQSRIEELEAQIK